MQNASDAFAKGAHPVIVARNITAFSISAIDGAVEKADQPVTKDWYERIGRAIEGLNSDASKMAATGKNYAAMEARGTDAATRFWS